jgi:hypothetical protein
MDARIGGRRGSVVGPSPANQRPANLPPAPVTRYSKHASETEVSHWYSTFKMFDRDGGGDVDLREIGLMFRQLGQQPTERQMRLLIEEVDADQSGTVDFEEFCCLMLRQARATRAPSWLLELLPADLDADDPLRATLPTAANLSDPKFEAARTIQKRLKGDAKKAALSAADSGRTAPGFSAPPSLAKPDQAADLDREQILTIVDLLPSASHIVSALLAGHGPLCGPFVTCELAWRLRTSSRTNLTALDLSFDMVGDEGACALAETLRRNSTLLHLDLSGNNISERGASALMAALCLPQETGPPSDAPPAAEPPVDGAAGPPSTSDKPPLRTLLLDENPIAEGTRAAIASQLLQNALPNVVYESTAPAARGKAVVVALSLTAAGGGNADGATAAKEGMELGELPTCLLTDEWLAYQHVPSLRHQLALGGIASLRLHECVRFSDEAVAALLANEPTPAQAPEPTAAAVALPPPPPPTRPLLLTRLRLSSCGLGNGVCDALTKAIRLGTILSQLRGLALDDNHLSLISPPSLPPSPTKPDAAEAAAAPAPVPAGDEAYAHLSPAARLGSALRTLVKLQQLDLCHNVLLSDAAASDLLSALLAATPNDGTSTPSAMALLHLGNTGAGNSSAVACAEALAEGSPLKVLCLSGDVGDVGARALATVLARGCALRELYVGNKIGDVGVDKLCAALSHKDGPCALETLVLGGLVRGDVLVTNRLESRSGQLLAEALRHNPDGPLQQLRLSGNSKLGGPACLSLVSSLATCSKLKALHIESCGLTKPEVPQLIEAFHEVLDMDRIRAIPGPSRVLTTPAPRSLPGRSGACTS